MHKGFTKIFIRFLSMLNIRVTKTSAEQFLKNHPEEGSMLAYSDALTHFKVENAVAKLDWKETKEIPKPLITYLQRDGGIFVLVKSIKNGKVMWYDSNKGLRVSKENEFIEDWSGIVLFAERNENSGEKDYNRKRRKEYVNDSRIPLAVLLFVFLVLTLSFNILDLGFSFTALLLLKLIGMLLTGLLLAKNLNSNNTFINKICGAGKNLNCQSILDSPAAKITSWLSWSDLGFIYFFGSLFTLLFSLTSPTALASFLILQAFFSGFGLLFSGYSLYYQGIKTRIWCALCLGVIATFFLETFTMFFLGLSAVSFFDVLPLAQGFAIPIIFLLLYKNEAILAQEREKLYQEIVRLKSNPTVVQALLSGQMGMPQVPGNLQVIKIGNQNSAAHSLTVISNPLCTPCAKMHKRISELLSKTETICCQVIFLSNAEEDNPGGQFVRKILSLPKELHSQSLDEWFERNDKNFKVWDEKYRQYPITENADGNQLAHNKWANKAKIKGTPALFLNGKAIPEIMKLEDLPLFLKHMKPEPAMATHGFVNRVI